MRGVGIKKPQGAGESARRGCVRVSESADEKYWNSAKAFLHKKPQHGVIWVKQQQK